MIQIPQKTNLYRQWTLGFVLFVLLVSIYTLTYRGVPLSRDEIYIFDTAESIVRRGELNRTYTFNDAYSNHTVDGEPWSPAVQEPLGVLLTVPLFLIGQTFNGIGIMHAVWLTNILLTAGIAVSLYCIALLRGYSIGVAFVGAFLFGVATVIWFYSRYIFREPLMAFFTLWCVFFALKIGEHWGKEKFPWKTGGFLIVAFMCALLTKVIALLLLPGLLLLTLPPTNTILKRKRLLTKLAGVVMVIGVLIFLTFSSGIVPVTERYSLPIKDVLEDFSWSYTLESLLGYNFSFSRSFWLYSPILILAFWGARMLIRRGQWRIVATLFMTMLGTAAVYGALMTLDWSGGWGWGPRFLLPLVPAFMLLVFPVLEFIYEKGHRAGIALVVTLGSVGVAIQLIGMAIPLSNYYTDLFFADKLYDYDLYAQNRQLFRDQWHWMDGHWTVRWSPIYYHIDRLDFDHLDSAWRVADKAAIPLIISAGLIIFSGGFALWILRRNSLRFSALASYSVAATTLVAIMLGATLYSVRHDIRYIQEWDDVYELVGQLNQSVDGNDIVLIDRAQYREIFMNYFKTPALIATLPYVPGEDYGFAEPTIPADAPLETLIGARTVPVLDWSAEHYKRVWLIASSSPFEPDKRRPLERYLAEHEFPATEVTVSPRARAIQFLSADTPANGSKINIEATFNDMLTLQEVDLPDGANFRASDGIPITLIWKPASSIDRDYTIGIYVIGQDGAVVAQRDALPQGGFGNTTTWQIGELYPDNHGLILPKTLPPGAYSLRIAVYYWQDGQRLFAVDDNGDPIGDTVQLTTIEIQ